MESNNDGVSLQSERTDRDEDTSECKYHQKEKVIPYYCEYTAKMPKITLGKAKANQSL